MCVVVVSVVVSVSTVSVSVMDDVDPGFNSNVLVLELIRNEGNVISRQNVLILSFPHNTGIV